MYIFIINIHIFIYVYVYVCKCMVIPNPLLLYTIIHKCIYICKPPRCMIRISELQARRTTPLVGHRARPREPRLLLEPRRRLHGHGQVRPRAQGRQRMRAATAQLGKGREIHDTYIDRHTYRYR